MSEQDDAVQTKTGATWIYTYHDHRQPVIRIHEVLSNDHVRDIALDRSIAEKWLEANGYEDTAIDTFLPTLIAAAVSDMGVVAERDALQGRIDAVLARCPASEPKWADFMPSADPFAIERYTRAKALYEAAQILKGDGDATT